MTERTPCSALLADSKCKNGFLITAPCHGIDGGKPICMNEKVCGRLYEQTGGVPIEIRRALSTGDTNHE